MEWLDRINPQMHLVWRGVWPAGFVEARRQLADHELVVFSRGHSQVVIEEHKFDCPSGTFLIVPAGRWHLTRAGSEPVFRDCIHFDWVPCGARAGRTAWTYWPTPQPGRQVRRAPRFVPKGVLYGRVPPDSPVPGLLKAIALRWDSGSSLQRSTCRALLLEALMRLLSSDRSPVGKTDRETELALRIRDRLNQADLSRMSVQDELERLGYSYEHLCRIFKRRFGIPPLRYATYIRLERAKQLLEESGLTVCAVARQCGFEDPGYFARAFRKYMGVAPSEFLGR
jgi:AraC-like DNA-binding protein